MNNEAKDILKRYLLAEHDVNDTNGSLFINIPTTKDNHPEDDLVAFGETLGSLGIRNVKMYTNVAFLASGNVEAKTLQFDGQEAEILRDIRRTLASEVITAQKWDNTRNPAAMSLDITKLPEQAGNQIMASLAILGVGRKEDLTREHGLMDSGYTVIREAEGRKILEITGTERFHLESVMQRYEQLSARETEVSEERASPLTRFFAITASALGLKLFSEKRSGQRNSEPPSGDTPAPL